MKVLRIKHTTRRYRCDVPGCGALTNNLIAKRDDAARKPAHICDDCINGLYGILHPGHAEVIGAWEAGDLVERDDDGRWPDEPDDGLLPDETDAESVSNAIPEKKSTFVDDFMKGKSESEFAEKSVAFAPAVVNGTLAEAPRRGRKAKTE